MAELAVNSYVTQILWSIVTACNFVKMFEHIIKSFNSVLIVSFMSQPVKEDKDRYVESSKQRSSQLEF